MMELVTASLMVAKEAVKEATKEVAKGVAKETAEVSVKECDEKVAITAKEVHEFGKMGITLEPEHISLGKLIVDEVSEKIKQNISTPEGIKALIEQPPDNGLASSVCEQYGAKLVVPVKVESVEKAKLQLTDEQKEQILKETGWSEEIINAIESMEQYEIYKKANLHEAVIDGRRCLIKDIDMNYVDLKTGKINRELIEEGKVPIDAETGEKIELHHMGQNSDAPFAELCENSEHGDGNHSVLHPERKNSWRNDPEMKGKYNIERQKHWKERAKEV